MSRRRTFTPCHLVQRLKQFDVLAEDVDGNVEENSKQDRHEHVSEVTANAHMVDCSGSCLKCWARRHTDGLR